MCTAAAGGDHQGLGAGIQGRIPGIDVAARHFACPFGVTEVVRQGATTAGAGTGLHADSEGVQYGFQRLVDLRRQSRLHAALQHQDTTFGGRRSHLAAARFRHRDLLAQCRWQQRAQPLSDAQQGRETSPVGQDLDHQTAQQPLPKRTRRLPFHLLAADIEQAVIIDP